MDVPPDRVLGIVERPYSDDPAEFCGEDAEPSVPGWQKPTINDVTIGEFTGADLRPENLRGFSKIHPQFDRPDALARNNIPDGGHGTRRRFLLWHRCDKVTSPLCATGSRGPRRRFLFWHRWDEVAPTLCASGQPDGNAHHNRLLIGCGRDAKIRGAGEL